MKPVFSLHIVTGAPGAGKSETAEACARADPGFVALDMDWLIDSASSLAGKDIHSAAETWPAYNALWLEVMHSTLRNGVKAVLFAPLAPRDLEPLPAWCRDVHWLLLDCDDDVRRGRLSQRNWAEPRILEAIEDAADLRDVLGGRLIDTSRVELPEVVETITRWVRK